MSRRYYSTHSWTELCAFWAIVISGFAYLFGGIFKLLVSTIKSLNGTNTANILSSIYHIFTFLGNLALIVAVAIPAWNFVRLRRTGWKVVYWIALVGYAFGAVLGMLGGFGIIVW